SVLTSTPPSGAETSGDERELQRRLSPYDFPLLAAVIMLLGIGAVMVYSATINESTLVTGDGAERLRVHLVHIALGVGALVAATLSPYRAWRKLVYPGLLVVIALLALVIFIGTTAGNARRWIALPGFSLQPAELAKLAFVV